MDTSHGSNPIVLAILWVTGLIMEYFNGFSSMLQSHIPPLIMDLLHAFSWVALGVVTILTYKNKKK